MRALALFVLASTATACGRVSFDAFGGADAAAPFDGAPVDTAATTFLRCDGVDDLVDLDLGSPRRVRTLEARVRIADPTNAASGNRILSVDDGTTNTHAGIAIDTVNPPIGFTASLAANENSTGVGGGVAIGPDWTAIALVFDDNGTNVPYELFVNGAHDVDVPGPPSPLNDFLHAELCGGLTTQRTAVDIDWVRLSSVPRYTAAYVPPVTPPLDDDTLVLVDFDDLTFDDRAGNATPSTSGSVMITTD